MSERITNDEQETLCRNEALRDKNEILIALIKDCQSYLNAASIIYQSGEAKQLATRCNQRLKKNRR